MKKFIKIITAYAFLMATTCNVAKYGLDSATGFGFIAGVGFWITSVIFESDSKFSL